jgi:hypothetical protein
MTRTHRYPQTMLRFGAPWCLAALPMLSFAGIGLADSTVAPPLHLPRVIFECEAGTGATSQTCSAWIWHGASYSAVWSIGAIGQLTASGHAGEITFTRTDPAGIFAGLTGTYTGKWDGASFSDGKATFSLKGASNSGVWTGVAEVTPVIHTHAGMVRTVTSDEIYGVGRVGSAPYYNYYTAELTGYAIYSTRGPGSALKGTVIEDFRVVGRPPMKPGERRLMDIRSPSIPSDYVAGAAYPLGMAIAAIYTDGTTFGDSKVLAAMIGKRRGMIAALTAISGTLCKLGTQQASVAEVDAALTRQHAAEDGRSATEKAGRDAAYDYVSRALHPRGRLTDRQAIKRSWDLLDQVRTGLADPIKDSSGQATIPAAPTLACTLP